MIAYESKSHRAPGVRIETRTNFMTLLEEAYVEKRVDGRKFSALVIGKSFDQPEDVIQKAMGEVIVLMLEFNQVTQPIDNGPDGAVWAAECLTQALLAEDMEEVRKWLQRLVDARVILIHNGELPF